MDQQTLLKRLEDIEAKLMTQASVMKYEEDGYDPFYDIAGLVYLLRKEIEDGSKGEGV